VQHYTKKMSKEHNPLTFYSNFESPQPDCVIRANELEHRILKSIIAKTDNLTRFRLEDLETFNYALTLENYLIYKDEFNWLEIATNLSFFYANCFKLEHIAKNTRMKAQLLNYRIRSFLTVDEAPSNLVQKELSSPVDYPWDMLVDASSTIFVGSGNKPNLRIDSKGSCRTFFAGKPTQVDKISQDTVAICSAYSDGWYELVNYCDLKYHFHNRPVVIVFNNQNELFLMDIDGRVYKNNFKTLAATIQVGIAWRARFVNNNLFISDLHRPGALLKVNPFNLRMSVINIDPVIILNDICSFGDHYFLVDKMQGHVFIFSKDFKFIGKYLDFGNRYGFLCDPISIKCVGQSVYIVSWLGDRVTVAFPQTRANT
jgi:hypothetical protein